MHVRLLFGLQFLANYFAIGYHCTDNVQVFQDGVLVAGVYADMASGNCADIFVWPGISQILLLH